jgi:hypothetical protein
LEKKRKKKGTWMICIALMAFAKAALIPKATHIVAINSESDNGGSTCTGAVFRSGPTRTDLSYN